MRQIQIAYHGAESFLEELQNFKRTYDVQKNGKLMFQIYAEVLDESVAISLGDAISQVFPEVPYIGCSTSGNLVDCQLVSEIIVMATVFEYESTRVQVYQYDRSAFSVDEITEHITCEAKANPWVKAVEIYFTITKGSYTRFCDGLKDINPDIEIFGGVACSDDNTKAVSYVCSSAGGFSEHSIVIVFYGGEDFYVDSFKIAGWKPFGRKFRVTKSDGNLLQELDGIPAFDVFHKYLNINNDEYFFYNTMEFPLFYENNNMTLLCAPTESNEDRSITMWSDMEIGSMVRISHGDPKTILEITEQDSECIREFTPDVLHVFSCAARRNFWASSDPAYELEPFQDIAPSVGFFTYGEFVRTDGRLNPHNVTLVIAAMREGEKRQIEAAAPRGKRKELSRVPLVSRLATFINATSLDMEQMNRDLETANRNLQAAVITDGLTGLYNRAEIQRRIENCLAGVKSQKFSLVMMDLDNFKQVNDTYGHQKGDRVIITLADILHDIEKKSSARYSAGRWGGEEFMLLLPGEGRTAASEIAEQIRRRFADTVFSSIRSQTTSIGVTQANEDDTIDMLCTRVDTALYQAKQSGKNKVVVA